MMVLVNESGYVEGYAAVGTLVDGVEVPEPEDTEHFEQHYGAYVLKDGTLSYDEAQEAVLEQSQLADEIRVRREKECFSVVDRSQLWYDSLTEEQKTELKEWYQAWLDATDTLVIPDRPGWL